MSSIAARYYDLLSAVGGCRDRLISPAVTDAAERGLLGRLCGSLIGLSFILAAAFALVMPPVAGAGGVLAAVAGCLAAFWLAALIAAHGRWVRAISCAALAANALAIPALIGLSGNMASPLLPLMIALVFEPAWVFRTARAAGFGAAAMGGGGLLLMGVAASAPDGAATAWAWLPTMAYAAWLAVRIAPSPAAAETKPGRADLLTATGALVLSVTPGGDVTEVSGDTRDMLGVAPEMLLGTGLFDRILVSDRVGYLCALGELREQASMRRVEALIRMPSQPGVSDASHYRMVEIELVSTGETGLEIAAILRRNDRLNELNEKLASADDRCAGMDIARNRLLAAVSHELRTPLNAIIGFSDMLLLELFGAFNDPRQKEYITLVRDSGHHLLEVVNSILDVSKIESGAYAITPEPFRLAGVVDLVSSMLAGEAKAKSVALATAIEDAPDEIVADRRAVQQMLINLVSNAVKFTPAGGKVAICASTKGGNVCLAVRDNGIGIAQDDLARLGEPFTQVRNDYTRQYDGAGLGLSLVKGLVALHDGAMAIESAPGHGTTVTLTLPIAGPAAQAAPRGRLIALDGVRAGEKSHGVLRKTA